MRLVSQFAVALLLAGCSASPTNPSPIATTDAGTKDAAAPKECPVCSSENSGDPPPTGYECIKTLETSLVDLEGRPVEGATVMACSKGLCTADVTKADGRVRVVPCAFLREPSFKVVGLDKFFPFSIPLRNPQDAFLFENVPVARLPATGAPFKVGEAHSIASNDVRLDIGAGAKNVEVDPFAPFTDFRALRIPNDKKPKGIDAGLDFELIYALAPQSTMFSPPARMSIPNSEKWSAGTAVELYLHNVDTTDPAIAPVTFGKWWKVATGKVTADGSRIETDAGSGIPMLTMLGVRRAKG